MSESEESALMAARRAIYHAEMRGRASLAPLANKVNASMRIPRNRFGELDFANEYCEVNKAALVELLWTIREAEGAQE